MNYLDLNPDSQTIIVLGFPTPNIQFGSIGGSVPYVNWNGLGVINLGTTTLGIDGPIQLSAKNIALLSTPADGVLSDVADVAEQQLTSITGLNFNNVDTYSVKIGGENVRIQFDRNTMDQASIESAKFRLQSVANLINNNLNELSDQETSDLRNVDTIVVTGAVQRSSTVENLGAYVVSLGELTASPAPSMASTLFHEGGHVRLFRNGGGTKASRGLAAEQQLTEEQIVVLGKLEAEEYEIDFLESYLLNTPGIQQRLETNPFSPPPPGSPPSFSEVLMEVETVAHYYGTPPWERDPGGGGGYPLP
jgi:hypothetical protein